MWKNRCASIKDDPDNPALIKSVRRGCVRVEKTEGVCVSVPLETAGLYHDLIREKWRVDVSTSEDTTGASKCEWH